MKRKSFLLLSLVVVLHGCGGYSEVNSKTNILTENISEAHKTKDQRLIAEIEERTDFRVSDKTSTEQLQKTLATIVDKSYQRYSSHKLGDNLSIEISQAKILKDSFSYVVRPVNFTISRSDSRMIPFKDLDFLESGIETNVRFTYSENGILYIDGDKKFRVSLSAKPTVDYQRITLKNGDVLSFEYRYSLPQ